jgi:hypothetical protein
MISRIAVVPDCGRSDLEIAVRDAWQAFESAVPAHPLVNVPVMFGPPDQDRVGDAIAIAMPHLDPAGNRVEPWTVVLGERFWSQTAEGRNLTLLHESIHLHLHAEKGARTVRSDSLRRKLRAAEREAAAMEGVDKGFKRWRGVTAMQFHLFPDEIWAELFVRDRYPEWLERRLIALLAMREATRSERSVQLAKIPPPLHGWCMFFELIRVELVMALELDERRLARLRALKASWISGLEQQSPGTVPSTLRKVREAIPRPLDVDAVSEVPFDEFCHAILAVSPH